MKAKPLTQAHELAYRTQYAELKERSLSAGELLPGTPGTLYLRSGTGLSYWYRVYYSAPGKQVENMVCKEHDLDAEKAMREQISFSDWMAKQVGLLKKLGFQVADKATARVLVELHNQGMFEAGLVLVGTLGYMAWLNELGVRAIAARTMDVDVARRQQLKLAAPLSFLESMKATGLPFSQVPGMPSSRPSTSVKLPGVQGLRVDVLAPGTPVGAVVAIPELAWQAQAIPFYDYLLESPEPGAMLAGGHCVPTRLPQAARFVWHKLYASTQRKGFPEKAEKDRTQALVLASALTEIDTGELQQAFEAAPTEMIEEVLPLKGLLLATPGLGAEVVELLEDCLT